MSQRIIDFGFDVLLLPFFDQINLEKAESAYYLYRNWSKSALPPKKPVWTDRHKNPGHLGHRDTENADKNVNSSKKEESRILSRLE